MKFLINRVAKRYFWTTITTEYMNIHMICAITIRKCISRKKEEKHDCTTIRSFITLRI